MALTTTQNNIELKDKLDGIGHVQGGIRHELKDQLNKQA